MLDGEVAYGGGRIDLRTGDAWPTPIAHDAFDDEADGADDDPDRWLYVRCAGSRAGYRDLEVFIASVADPAVADRLDIAISGRGAFRRCTDVLSRWPDECYRYRMFSDERRRGRARAWLADEGYRAHPSRDAVE